MSTTAPSIKVVKSFSYRGAVRLWSNRYYFTNSAPSDATHWTTFSDAVVTAEKACLPNGTNLTTIVQTVGYNAGSEVPVFTKTYATTGTFAPSPNWMAPGDSALMVRYSTADRSVKNHPIYLFNYYHAITLNLASQPDTPLAGHRTAYQTYAGLWVSGFSDGTATHARCGPKGHQATGYVVDTVIRHRDFPSG